jgi:predicted  nucleic acid-binding Zn-ribbon protein
MVGLCEQPQSAQDDDSKGMEDIEASRKIMLEKRQSLTSQLPRQVLSRYELIRKRRGIAIAATSNGICTACHMVAPPQLFQKILRNDTLEQCPHCQRILYYKPEEPEETSE